MVEHEPRGRGAAPEAIFWGVRGSVATPGPSTARYGGNTSAVEVRWGERSVLLDCGTGARALGQRLVRLGQSGAPRHVAILLGHYHLDHIQGLPFFAPLYEPDWHVEVWAPRALGAADAAVERVFSPPTFPLTWTDLPARLELHGFEMGEAFAPAPGLRVQSAPLLHPGGCAGFRVEFAEPGAGAYAHLVDTEHPPAGQAWPEAVQALVRGARVLTYDAMFSPERYPERRGWGHSTFAEGLALAEASGVEVFVATHHDPEHDDDALDALEARARARFSRSVVAREGTRVDLALGAVHAPSSELRP